MASKAKREAERIARAIASEVDRLGLQIAEDGNCLVEMLTGGSIGDDLHFVAGYLHSCSPKEAISLVRRNIAKAALAVAEAVEPTE